MAEPGNQAPRVEGLMKGRGFAMAMGLLVLASACGGPEEAGEAEAPESFTVQLPPGATEEQATLEIVAAAHAQLATACAEAPASSVRIFHPLASAGVDVPCSAVLDAEVTGASREALVSSNEGGEPIGEARQKWSIFGIACWAATAAIAAAGNFSCAEVPHETTCPWGVWGGTTAFSVLCTLL
jgi:hypothetical protein